MKIFEFFQEENGALSSARLLMIFWGIGVLAMWAVLSVQTGVLVTIPESVITLFGVTVMGKVIQKFKEVPPP